MSSNDYYIAVERPVLRYTVHRKKSLGGKNPTSFFSPEAPLHNSKFFINFQRNLNTSYVTK